MFIEIDDGCYVNTDNIFSITYKSYNNKGLWVFSSSYIEERDSSLADKSNRKVYSRTFFTRGEADTWLEGILNRVGAIREKNRQL